MNLYPPISPVPTCLSFETGNGHGDIGFWTPGWSDDSTTLVSWNAWNSPLWIQVLVLFFPLIFQKKKLKNNFENNLRNNFENSLKNVCISSLYIATPFKNFRISSILQAIWLPPWGCPSKGQFLSQWPSVWALCDSRHALLERERYFFGQKTVMIFGKRDLLKINGWWRLIWLMKCWYSLIKRWWWYWCWWRCFKNNVPTFDQAALATKPRKSSGSSPPVRWLTN